MTTAKLINIMLFRLSKEIFYLIMLYFTKIVKVIEVSIILQGFVYPLSSKSRAKKELAQRTLRRLRDSETQRS